MKKIKIKNIKDLKPGDTIRHIRSGGIYIVKDIFANHAEVYRAVRITNPKEWELLNFNLKDGTDQS